VLSSRTCCFVASVPLIHKGTFYCFTDFPLYSFCEFSNLSSTLLISSYHMLGEQMSKRVNCKVDLITLTSFGTIVARTSTTFRC
jgi:hypothetical protein